MRITGSSRPSTTAVVGSIDMVVEAGVWEEEEASSRTICATCCYQGRGRAKHNRQLSCPVRR
jgi:hypothetical protein